MSLEVVLLGATCPHRCRSTALAFHPLVFFAEEPEVVFTEADVGCLKWGSPSEVVGTSSRSDFGGRKKKKGALSEAERKWDGERIDMA